MLRPIVPWVALDGGHFTVHPHFVQGKPQRTHNVLLTVLRAFVGQQAVFGIFAVKLKGPRILMQDAIIAVGSEGVTIIADVGGAFSETDPDVFTGAYDSLVSVELKRSRMFMHGVDIAFRTYDELKWFRVVEMDKQPAAQLARMIESARAAVVSA